MIDLHHLWMFFDWVKKDSESTNSSAVAARQRAGWCLAWAGQRLQIPPSMFPEFKLGFICPINAKSDTSFLQQKLVRVLLSGLFRAQAEIFFAKSHGNEFFFIGGGNRRRKNKVYFYLLCGEKLKKEVHQFLTRERERRQCLRRTLRRLEAKVFRRFRFGSDADPSRVLTLVPERLLLVVRR